jgi:ABC-2 type transport system ATP-binding protein
MTEKPLVVTNLKKSYGALEALKGVSFEVRAGEVFGLLGPNGAGKTSLISVAVTMEAATAGEVRVFGHSVSGSPREAKRRLGWVGQEIVNHGFFDVVEIMTYYAGYFGVKRPRVRIEHLLHELDLFEHRHKKVKQLSGGMKRRLMIAKALVHEPGLLLLDEPTAGVDVELRQKLWTFVQAQQKQGLSVLLTTHYLEEAEQLCQRVAILHQGQIREAGETKELVRRWSRKHVHLVLASSVEEGRVAQWNHPELTRRDGRQVWFDVDTQKGVGQLLAELGLSSQDIHDVRVEEGRLEEAFLRVTYGGRA